MPRGPDGSLPAGGRLNPLTIYGFYRVVLAAAIAFLFIANLDASTQLEGYRPQIFLLTSVGYFFGALLTSLTIRLIASRDLVRGTVLIGIDIVALALLAHSSGGVSSTITPLLVVTVAAAGIILPGRTAIVVAAAATLVMLYEQFYFSLENGLPVLSGSTRVGLLGVAFFGVAFATSQLTRRMQASEQLAWQRSRDVVDLEQLNAHIIQRMRTGILVVDDAGAVKLANSAAQHMLSGRGWRGAEAITAVSADLAQRIADWRADATRRAPSFRGYAGGPEIDASMAAIRLGDRHATLVFLEDLGALSQHLQQMKLASLGRLTASIAHEIRNPLSAINHASQLLAESPGLPAAERRLTEIIQQQTLRLDRTVESVLQLSRRQVPAADLLDLSAWLTDFRRDYLAIHGNQSDDIAVVVPETRVRARFDTNHLQQIVRNLCDNGLRHGRKLAGVGRVRLELMNSEAGDIPLLRVIDNGAGIPEEKVDSLFEPFFTTEPSGTGLGLYIARELCEANRARLSYIPPGDGQPGYFQVAFAHPGRIAS